MFLTGGVAGSWHKSMLALVAVLVSLLSTAVAGVAVWAPAANAGVADDFVYTVDTTLRPGAPVHVFTWATDHMIDWGDGNVNTNDVHTYATDGAYQIRVLMDAPVSNSIPLCFWPANPTDSEMCQHVLVSVESWGLWAPSSWDSMFFRAEHLVSVPATSPPFPSGEPADIGARAAFSGAISFNGDLSGWDMSRVNDLSFFFRSAANFNGDISSWDTSRVTNMNSMFYGAAAFNQNIGSWDTSRVTNMENMFHLASSFNQNLTSWDMSSVRDMKAMFSGASSFNGAVGGWNVSAATDFEDLFRGASSFNQDIGDWNIGQVRSLSGAFENASAFNQDIPVWDTRNVTHMTRTFAGASSFNGDVGGWHTGKVSDMTGMFMGASSFNRDISSWDTSLVTSMKDMFYGAAAFDQGLSSWSTYEVATMEGMFRGATAFNGTVSNWNVSKVTSMAGMFQDAASFNQDISAWNTSSVTDLESIFQGASSFNHPVGSWDTREVKTMGLAFKDASSFNQSLGTWSLASMVNMTEILDGSGIGPNAYSDTLVGWASQPLPANVVAGTVSTFTRRYAANASGILKSYYRWYLVDKGGISDADYGRMEAVNGFAATASEERVKALASGVKIIADEHAAAAEAAAAGAQASCDAIVEGSVRVEVAKVVAQAQADAAAARIYADSLGGTTTPDPPIVPDPPVRPEPPAPPALFPPGPPTELTATYSDGKITVRWGYPAASGSFPVTNYAVNSSDGQTCTTAAFECTFTGLIEGRTYSFTVRALNGAGWGSWSAPAEALVPEKPREPYLSIESWELNGRKLVVHGTALDLPPGSIPVAMVRARGQSGFTPGSAQIVVAEDGTFTWTRRIKKTTYLFFEAGGTTSERVKVLFPRG